jgi:hypothetical protein
MKGLISRDVLYNSYSNDIEKADQNPEVRAFVKESQKESPGSTPDLKIWLGRSKP